MQAHPHPGGLPDQLNPEQKNPTLNPGGLSNGDSPILLVPAGIAWLWVLMTMTGALQVL